MKPALKCISKKIASLLDEAAFSDVWEERLWNQVQGAREMLEPDNQLLIETEQPIFDLYFQQIQDITQQGEIDWARELIEHAKRYAHGVEEKEKLSKQQLLLVEIEKDREQIEQEKAEEEAVKRRAAIRSQFNTALASIKRQLACSNTPTLDMPKFDNNLKILKSIDSRRYKNQEASIISGLSSCIKKVVSYDPVSAATYKKSAMSIFPGNRIIGDIKLDPCDISLAGLGSRGKGGACRDVIPNFGKGPSMVGCSPQRLNKELCHWQIRGVCQGDQ